MEIPTINISGHYTTSIWLCSDLHYGHKKCDEEHFELYLKWLGKGKYHKMLGIGDYLETALPSTMGGKAIWDQKYTPQQQIDGFIEMMEPYKSKIIGLVDGNHERRVRSGTSINPVKIIADRLQVPYLGYLGWICFDTGTVKYYMMYHHGKGGSQTVDFPFRKLNVGGYHGVDIKVVAHAHNLAWIPKPYLTVNRKTGNVVRKICHSIRSGGFLKEPEYAMIGMYPVSSIGSPILELHPTKKQISVRMGVVEDMSYGFEDGDD